MNRIVPWAVLALLALAPVPVFAQGVVVGPPVVTYYYPPAPVLVPAPRVSYYYAPSPIVTYPAPTITYYADPYYPPPVTAYRYGLFGRRIVTSSYYPPVYLPPLPPRVTYYGPVYPG